MNWVPNSLSITPTYRHDVAQAFIGACPGVTDISTGYIMTFDVPPPVGYWSMWLVWATDDGGYHVQQRTIDID